MLVNGKEVNNLILNGQTFISENLVPSFYNFPNDGSYGREYELKITDNEPIFSIRKFNDSMEHYTRLITPNRVLIIRIINYARDKYALAYISAWSFDSRGGIGTKRFAWIKLSEFSDKMNKIANELYPSMESISDIVIKD